MHPRATHVERDTILVTGSRVQNAEKADDADALRFEQAMDEAPPASFATPETRDEWLRRIRELVRENRVDDARESLREFRRRHPGHVLPEDLKALLDE